MATIGRSDTESRERRLAGMAELKLILVVACALIDADNRVLLAQRPEGKPMAGLWEFPGGKVEPASGRKRR